jgi:hypothetical protein
LAVQFQDTVAIVVRFELRAVNRNARGGEQTKLTAEREKLGTSPADGSAIIPPEIGDRLVVGNQAAGQPHNLNIARRLAFQPTARLLPGGKAIRDTEKSLSAVSAGLGTSTIRVDFLT